MISYNNLTNVYASLAYLHDLVVERAFPLVSMNDNVGFMFQNLNKTSNISAYNVGVVTALVFRQYYNMVYKNPELFEDNNRYYFSFFDLYKFYGVDMYRASFLFFENVRHSTKLEIV